MATHPSRRTFVLRTATLSAVLSSGALLSGCLGSGDAPAPEFLFGVASGDPLADRVILWTHARFAGSDESVSLGFEVATDATFATVVASGTVVASAASGHTAKVDATGLQADTRYFYRFTHGLTRSPVGQTRTLPLNPSQVQMAVVSCSNFPAGFFHVYAEIARSPAQYLIHLGDYIYEYGVDGYASANAGALGRLSVPANELLSLDDYRRRHAQYKSDPDSKTVHAAMPLIAVWDDHEVANNAYLLGAQEHNPATEGTWEARRAAAVQAYHEWMPIRTGSDRLRIFRSFQFGNLLSLHMLDTRLVGRERQVDIGDLAGLNGPAARTAAITQYANPSRQLLGTAQLQWLQGQLAASSATWQVLGSQVLMARMEIPATILSALNPANVTPAAQAAGQQAINDYLTARATPAAQRTPAQVALLDPATNPRLGYNLDAWDGYIAARETVLGTAAQLGRRLVSLAGDTHNAWHSNLTLMGLANPAQRGFKVGEEFATPSVSSPGLEEYLRTIPPAQVKGIFENVVEDLRWMDASNRGYLLMTFTPAQTRAEWFFVSSVSSRSYTARLAHSATLAA